MADVYEKDLAQKTSLTTSDYIRVVGSDNVSYKQLVSDVASKIIATYATNSLGGKTQSIKSFADHWGTSIAYTGNIDELYESSIYVYDNTVATGTFPTTVRYGTIVTFGGTSSNYATQIAKANASDGTLYIRYRVSGAYTAWERLSTMYGTIATNTDLNNITDAGVYLVSGSNSYTNLPSGITYGTLEVVKSTLTASILFQRITNTDKMATRYKSGSTWYSWRIYNPS